MIVEILETIATPDTCFRKGDVWEFPPENPGYGLDLLIRGRARELEPGEYQWTHLDAGLLAEVMSEPEPE